MRTEAITKTYNVYKFNELSDDAKENVKRWYLDGQEEFIFTDNCKMDLYNLFGKNELDVQYSLSYCQGDGFNIYCKIYAEDIIKCLEKHNGGTQLEQFENVLTEEEKKIILDYAKTCGAIEIPMNSRYCYCMADYLWFAEDWEEELNYWEYENINVEALGKFETMVRGIFRTLCGNYKRWGYEYFYEISDEDLEETCEANEWEFLEDGTIF